MVMYSRSASDKYTGIIEKTGSQNASAFQRSINGTLFSGEFTQFFTAVHVVTCEQ